MLPVPSHTWTRSWPRHVQNKGTGLRTRFGLLLSLSAIVFLSLAGCQDEPIETHRVERLAAPPPPEAKVRLLGAIIPHAKDTWFFKLVGKLDAIEPLKVRSRSSSAR